MTVLPLPSRPRPVDSTVVLSFDISVGLADDARVMIVTIAMK